MTALDAAIYGVVQGLTEFIPVSSTAHLEIASALLPPHRDIGAAFTAVIQWGTWVACVIYFRKDIGRLTRAFFLGIWENRPWGTHDAQVAWMLLVGTVPIGVIGILLKKHIETTLRGLVVLACAAIGLALLLAVAEVVHILRVRAGKVQKDMERITWFDALLVGFFQCIALIPGASRSGTTITGGIFTGMTRETAARFSFLLSLPSVFAAGLYELYEKREQLMHSQGDVLNLVIATVVSGIVGYASIAFLIRFLKSHSTWVFIVYRVVLGAVLLYLILGAHLLPNELPSDEPVGRAGGVSPLMQHVYAGPTTDQGADAPRSPTSD
jgi:undecaprenyl-diphosphatase